MNKKRDSKSIIIIAVGVVIYLACSVLQAVLSRQAVATGGNNPMSGVLSQIQVVDSVLIVMLAQRNGFIAASLINGLNILITLIMQVILQGNKGALPGILVNLISVGLCMLIFFYTDKTEKMNKELQESYQEAIEKNRIIEQQSESMKFLAYFDKLTQLPNREMFMEQLERHIKENGDCVMIYVDMDDFRRINDNFGHAVGDDLLKRYAEKILRYCGDKAFAAKIGGDEFGIILGSGMTNEAIYQYAAGISAIFSEPVNIGGNVYTVAASYGAANFPENAMTADDLFRCAETAMFNAKESGKNQLCFYTKKAS